MQALVIGTIFGSIYGLTAYGLALSYRLSGVFNFAHGAIGMLGAFLYTDLVETHGWPRLAAFLFILGVYAPLAATAGNLVLFRYLAGKSVTVQVAGTTLLALALFEYARRSYTNTSLAVLPSVFGEKASSTFERIGGLNLSHATLYGLALSAGVIVVLTALLRYLRFGVATRAVVENEELATLVAVPVARVRTASWVMGSMVATVAAILIASEVQLDQTFLTLIVVDAAAAFVLGRLESPIAAAAGGWVIGVLLALQFEYLPTGGLYDGLRRSFGFVVLYVAAVALGLRGARQAVGKLESVRRSASEFIVPSRRALILPVLALCAVTPALANFRRFEMGSAFVFATLFLSFFVVMGMGGFTSLAQLTFMGFGAFATGRLADTFGVPVIMAIAGGALVAAVAGLIAALPAIRVRGLLLAMITLALALFADNMLFGSPAVTGIESGGGGLGIGAGFTVGRPGLFGVDFSSDLAFALFAATVYLAVALLVRQLLARGGLRVVLAVRDNPEMCEAFGLNLRGAKVGFFVLGAGIAGLAGGLFVSQLAQVSNFEFQTLRGLVFLAVAVLAGTDHLQGPLLGGLIWAFGPLLLNEFAISGDLLFTVLGIAGIGVLHTKSGSLSALLTNAWRSGRSLLDSVRTGESRPAPLTGKPFSSARNRPAAAEPLPVAARSVR
ncbi:MAG: ABC transporter permease [Actinomycetota bacterium]